jgi:hypothetical protein
MAEDIIIPRKHYDPLIESATQLVTVANNAAATILEGSPYESMLRGPADALAAALADVPGAVTWNGIWRDIDVIYDTFRHDAQPRNKPDLGIKATHIPTNVSVESYSQHTVEANQAAAKRGLRDLVERRASGMTKP